MCNWPWVYVQGTQCKIVPYPWGPSNWLLPSVPQPEVHVFAAQPLHHHFQLRQLLSWIIIYHLRSTEGVHLGMCFKETLLPVCRWGWVAWLPVLTSHLLPLSPVAWSEAQKMHPLCCMGYMESQASQTLWNLGGLENATDFREPSSSSQSGILLCLVTPPAPIPGKKWV